MSLFMIPKAITFKLKSASASNLQKVRKSAFAAKLLVHTCEITVSSKMSPQACVFNNYVMYLRLMNEFTCCITQQLWYV